MDANSNNNTKTIKRKVVDHLVEGYESATQLQVLLSHHQHSTNNKIHQTGSGLVSCDPVNELLAKILGSFHKTISVLDSFDSLSDVVSAPIAAVEGSRNASCGDDSTAPLSCNGGDSGDSKKRLGVTKGKRGCYTRKKRAYSETITSRKIEDRHAWRKYGQKLILNSTFPRSYFRCTYKQTRGCNAMKQVQKQEIDPEMYQITYIGYHTCNANDDQTQAKTEPFDQEINMDSANTLAAAAQDYVVNAKVQQEQENNISSVTMVSAVKEEKKKNNNGDDQNNKEYCEGSSTGDQDLSLVWQESMMFDDHQNHFGEISTTSQQFAFIDNDPFSSLFDSYCAYEGTSAI